MTRLRDLVGAVARPVGKCAPDTLSGSDLEGYPGAHFETCSDRSRKCSEVTSDALRLDWKVSPINCPFFVKKNIRQFTLSDRSFSCIALHYGRAVRDTDSEHFVTLSECSGMVLSRLPSLLRFDTLSGDTRHDRRRVRSQSSHVKSTVTSRLVM